MTIKFADSLHSTLSAAANAWAQTALPDASVLGAEEDAVKVATDLEAHWWLEGQYGDTFRPDDVSAGEWRTACRAALRTRIDAERVRLIKFTTEARENIAETSADVAEDLRALRSGETTPSALLAHCLNGADDDRAEGWRDYVTALSAAAGIEAQLTPGA